MDVGSDRSEKRPRPAHIDVVAEHGTVPDAAEVAGPHPAFVIDRRRDRATPVYRDVLPK
jgi:hypothetical protein